MSRLLPILGAILLLAGPSRLQAQQVLQPWVHLTFDSSGNLTQNANLPPLTVTSYGAPTFDPGGLSGGALRLDGSTALIFDSSIAAILAGNFSFSLWLKTTQAFAWDTAQGYEGAGIVYADVPGLNNDTVPLALTGNLAGFHTGGSLGDSTLHSTHSINSGNWTHVVVTHDSVTGARSIYINGALDATDFGSTGALNAKNTLLLGGNDVDGRYFVGLVDDFQAYNVVLSPAQVSFLYANPGLTVVPEPSTVLLLLFGAPVLLRHATRAPRGPA